jgi:2-methylcitrate dehydratase PrpD
MTPLATRLAEWAHSLVPDESDLALARRSLLDTVAVTLAGRGTPMVRLAGQLAEGGRWAALGHVLDFDDLHTGSTAHVSVVCVPSVLAAGGGARDYLAGAGVMARIGTALGWRHYAAGWHTTCTAGAPAAAVAAALAMGLSVPEIATALVLALPAAGGVQRTFGTDGKSLQVGFAVDAGVRAARLAAAGAKADLTALEAWLGLLGASPNSVDLTGPAVPGGLAVKMYPCCYALQRPISALHGIRASLPRTDNIARIVIRTPKASVTPLIHHRPATGLEGKFSLEYGAAAAVLDAYPGFASFTDEAVVRPAARRLAGLVASELEAGGDGLLDGQVSVEVVSVGGDTFAATERYPLGSPQRPPNDEQLRRKLASCLDGMDTDPERWTWESCAGLLCAVR